MTVPTTPGRILLKRILPQGMRKEDDIIDKKSLQVMMKSLAEKAPDRYVDVLQEMVDHSKVAAYRSGHLSTISLSDLIPSPEVVAIQDEMKAAVHKISQSDIPKEEKNKQIAAYVMSRTKELSKQVTDIEAAKGNRLALAAKLGFRGNADQFQQIIFGDAMNADFRGRAIPISAFRGYGQGVSPLQCWSGAYSARKGDVDTQFATADTGYFCLSENTEVMMGDWSSKRIKDIVVGDMVIGSDKHGHPAAVAVTGVCETGVKNVYRYVFYQINDDGIILECTREHEILSVHWKHGHHQIITQEAVGLLHPDGATGAVVVGSEDVAVLLEVRDLGPVRTLDIEIDNKDHLFVLANGLVVSNSKQMSNASASAIVTEDDCGTKNGDVRQANDPDVIGSVLAADIGQFKAGDVVTRSMAKSLADKPVIVRTCMTCQASGGICKKCAGVRDSDFPRIGSFIGIEAGRIVTEPLTQGLALNSRHVGGTAGVNENNLGAFQEINQFVNVPETFVGAAALAPADGTVTKIEDAPQGGSYIHIGGHAIYSHPDYPPTVKVGQKVEAGDSLSEGTINLRQYSSHRSVGESRKFFADAFNKLLADKGQPTSKKNTDILAREIVGRVEVTNPEGIDGYDVGEVVSYDDLAKRYKPPADSVQAPVEKSVNKYLQTPVLHYTIGTRMTPSVVKTLKDVGVNQVHVSGQEPGFRPSITRLIDIPSKDPDWMVRLTGWNVKRSFVDAVQKGSVSTPKRTSFARKMVLPEELDDEDNNDEY